MMRLILVLLLILPLGGCFETGGGAAGLETDAVIDPEIGTEVDGGIDIDGMSPQADTPPIVGPGETQGEGYDGKPLDKDPEDIIDEINDTIESECAEKDYECTELTVESDSFCLGAIGGYGSIATEAQASVHSSSPMSDAATVDLFVKKLVVIDDEVQLIDSADLTVTPSDADPPSSGYQLPVDADGKLHFEVKSGTEKDFFVLKAYGRISGNGVLAWTLIGVKDSCRSLRSREERMPDLPDTIPGPLPGHHEETDQDKSVFKQFIDSLRKGETSVILQPKGKKRKSKLGE